MIQGTYYKEWSRMLGRDMEFKVYGHAGTPVLALPARGGRFYDWENNGMPDAIAPLLNEGKVQLFCADSIDAEPAGRGHGSPPPGRDAGKVFQLPDKRAGSRILTLNGAKKDTMLWAVGVDTGAYQAVNCRLRRPEVFAGAIGLSGLYDVRRFLGNAADDLVLRNAPWPVWQRTALWTRSCWQRLRRMPFSSVPVRAATRATRWWTPRPWPMH